MDITYVTNRDKAYRFDITESDLVDTLTGAAANGESVGRFVALARKRGALAQQTAQWTVDKVSQEGLNTLLFFV